MELKVTIFALISIISGLMIENVVTKEDVVSNLANYYDKINEHLLKHVKSEDPEVNMNELKLWRKNPALCIRGGRLLFSVKQLISMPEAVVNSSTCNYYNFEILENNDMALFSSTRLEQDNYTLQRIDRIIQYYFEKFLFLCPSQSRHLWHVQAAIGWKKLAYERINKFLETKDLSGKVSEPAMEALKEWLVTLEKENKDGALTDAVRQVVSLDYTIGDNKCSRESHHILAKNEVAVQPRGFDSAIIRVHNLVISHLENHAKTCYDIHLKKFQEAINNMDETTKRSVLILISEFFFQEDKFEKLAESIEHSDYAQINSDFTTPEVIQLVKKVILKKENQDKVKFNWDDYYTTNILIYRALKLIMTKSHPDYKYLTRSYRDESAGMKAVDKDKIRELHEKYLLNPCKQFKKALDEEIFAPAKFDSFRFDPSLPEDEFMQRLGFKLGQYASNLCSQIIDLQDLNRDQIYRLAIKTPSFLIF